MSAHPPATAATPNTAHPATNANESGLITRRSLLPPLGAGNELRYGRKPHQVHRHTMNEERRDPPVRIHVTGLQEAQLPGLVAIENDVAAARTAAGVPEDLATPKTDGDIVRLKRHHDVRVLEADHEAAGYLAWRDEAPGIAILEHLVIDPSLQRYGLGTRLLREIGEKAKEHGIAFCVAVSAKDDRSAAGFLSKRGFVLAGPRGEAPPEVEQWLKASGREVPEPRLEWWWASCDGLGFIPGLPPPMPTW